MDNQELSDDTKKLQLMSMSTDVLNTKEEVRKYNKLIEKAEMTTPETRQESVDGN